MFAKFVLSASLVVATGFKRLSFAKPEMVEHTDWWPSVWLGSWFDRTAAQNLHADLRRSLPSVRRQDGDGQVPIGCE